MEKSDQGGRGRVVLATVKGDVHDIGKNLVDIILTNNGYEVVNLGIKVGINEMLSAVDEHRADALGMSGLLVKSTLIMRENLELMNELEHVPRRRPAGRRRPDAHLRRARPAPIYKGRLFYGKDAFEGLRVLDRLGELRRGEDDPTFGREVSTKNVQRRFRDEEPAPEGLPERSPEVETDNPLFVPPFLGSRVAKCIPVDEISDYLNLTALFRNQWGYRPEDGEDDPAFKERVSAILREQMGLAKEEGLLIPQVVWGHFPAAARGQRPRDLHATTSAPPRPRASPSRASASRRTCASRTSFATSTSPDRDYASFMLVTMGSRVSERCQELFAANRYGDYLMLHGLGVEMAEALAELWHHRDPLLSSATSKRTARRSPASSASSTAGAATRGATRPART